MTTYKVPTPKGSAGGSALGLGMGIVAGAKPVSKQSKPDKGFTSAKMPKSTVDKVNAALDPRAEATRKQTAMAKARKK